MQDQTEQPEEERDRALGQHPNSILAKLAGLPESVQAKYRRNAIRFKEDQGAMEDWAANDFGAGEPEDDSEEEY